MAVGGQAMSGANLGAGPCQQCGGPITGKGRRDRKYCSASCRTVAWSERAGRNSGKASSRVAATQLDDGLVDRLADALVLRFAQGDTVPAARRPAPQPVAATPVINAESEVIKELQAEMARLRSDLERSRTSSSSTSGSKPASAVLHLPEAVKFSPPSYQPATGQPRTGKQLTDGQADGGSAAATAAQLEQLKAAHRKQLAAKEEDHDRLTREFSALFLSHNKIETALENATTEKQSLTKRIRDLERQCEAAKAEAEALRKELQPLRQVLSEEDPLLFVMRSKVNLQHLIAIGREALGSNKHGRRLPDEKPATRETAAVYAAYAARQEYFASCAGSRKDKATWVVQGRRLDPVSEQKLRKSEDANLKKLEQELSLTTRLREGR